jgi:hypothetical protein
MTTFYSPAFLLPRAPFDAVDAVLQPDRLMSEARVGLSLYASASALERDLRPKGIGCDAVAVDLDGEEEGDAPTFVHLDDKVRPEQQAALAGFFRIRQIYDVPRGSAPRWRHIITTVREKEPSPYDTMLGTILRALHVDGVIEDKRLFVTNPWIIKNIAVPSFQAEPEPVVLPPNLPENWAVLRRDYVAERKNARHRGSRCVHRWQGPDASAYVKKARTSEGTVEETLATLIAWRLGARVPYARLLTWAGRPAALFEAVAGTILQDCQRLTPQDLFRIARDKARFSAVANALGYGDINDTNQIWDGVHLSMIDLGGALRRSSGGGCKAFRPYYCRDDTLLLPEAAALWGAMENALPAVRDDIIAFAQQVEAGAFTVKSSSFQSAAFTSERLLHEVYTPLAWNITSTVRRLNDVSASLAESRRKHRFEPPRTGLRRFFPSL